MVNCGLRDRGGVNQGRNVARHPTPLEGLIHGFPQDGPRVLDSSRGKSLAILSAFFKHLVHHRLHMLRRKLGQLVMTKGGGKVESHILGIAVIGPRPC